MRINIHANNKQRLPLFFTEMVKVFIEAFSKEYMVSTQEAYRYFWAGNLERLQKLFAENGVQIETYDMEDLPSRGFIIPDTDPTVVFYKLKYSDPPEET